MTSPRRAPAILAALLTVALLATTAVAVVDARRSDAEADRLREQVSALEERVTELAAERTAPGGGADAPADALDGLLGGDVDDLLDDLLSGVSGELPGARCMAPADDDGGGLEDLLGGGLGELFGGGQDPRPDDPEQLVERIGRQVEGLRELTFDREVDVAFLDDDEVGVELERLLDEDLDRELLAAQADVLAALRAIPADADLEQLQRQLLEDQVAGYYSLEDEQLVVRAPEGEIRPLDEITLAHELDHALVDQVVGLPDLDDGTDADAALGRLSVVEGDASLLMNRWTLEHLSIADQLGIAGAGDLAGQQEQLAGFPHHLQRELVFPYTAGLDLVCDRWLAGGWAAVDALHADPPATSIGVLFPERADEEPVAPPELTAPDGATPRFDDTFGAAPLMWLFEAPGGDTGAALDEPAQRAAAWTGGEVHLWDGADGPVVGLTLADGDAGQRPLCASITDWFEAAAPSATRSGTDTEVRFVEDATATVIRCDDDGVRFATAPTAATAATVVGADG